MQRRILVTLLAAVALLVAPSAASAAPSERGQQHATGWYLSLGDSLAAGYQLGVDHPTEGYAGPTLEALQQTAPKTKLVNLACSGETTTSMIEGGRCTYEEGSQLDQAVEFLHAHRLTTRLVTLDIGGNDIAKCGFSGLQDSCIDPALATLRQNLPTIMERLHAAAPQAHIVVLNYYDPFLVYALQGPSGLPLAQKSLVVLGTFDGLIAANATAVGADVADVAGAFSTTSWTPLVPVPGIGSVPLNLARILLWTWMAPPRLDFHANDTGYAVMAGAVVAEL